MSIVWLLEIVRENNLIYSNKCTFSYIVKFKPITFLTFICIFINKRLQNLYISLNKLQRLNMTRSLSRIYEHQSHKKFGIKILKAGGNYLIKVRTVPIGFKLHIKLDLGEIFSLRKWIITIQMLLFLCKAW